MATDIPSTAVSSARAGCVVPALAVLIAIGVLAIAFGASTCVRPGAPSTYSAPLARFPPEQPVYLSSKRLYVVQLASGEVVALSQREPLAEHDRPACTVRYREMAAGDSRAGPFRGDCSGVAYDLTGMAVDGNGPAMRRHRVTVSGDRLTVDLKPCTQPPATPIAGGC